MRILSDDDVVGIVASFQGDRNHAVGLELPTHRPDAGRSRDLHRRPLPEPGPGGPPGRPLRRSWKEGSLPPEVRCVAVAAPGRTRAKQIWSFARNSEAALAKADYDCTVGFINTWRHDVIIPQGGVHGGSLQANALAVRQRPDRRLYVLGKMLNPRFWTYQAIERGSIAAERQARVVAVSNMVRRHIQQFHHVPRQLIHVVPNAIDPDRVKVAQPGAVRCAFRNRLGLEPSDLVGLFVGPQLRAQGPEAAPQGARGQAAEGRSPADPSAGLRRGPRRLVPAAGQRARASATRSISWASIPTSASATASSDFFVLPTYYDPCSLVVLEALACGLPVDHDGENGAGELITDGRAGLRPDRARRPGRADRRPRPHDRRSARARRCRPRPPGSAASRRSTATSRP